MQLAMNHQQQSVETLQGIDSGKKFAMRAGKRKIGHTCRETAGLRAAAVA